MVTKTLKEYVIEEFNKMFAHEGIKIVQEKEKPKLKLVPKEKE